MKAYRIKVDANALRFEGTLGEAHARVKEASKHFWPDTTVEEVEVRGDKEGLIAALNGVPEVTVKRTFGITSRGALKEEQPDL